MSISHRLYILMASSILALILVGGIGYLEMRKVHEVANAGNTNSVPSLIALGQSQQKFMVLRIRVYRDVTTADTSQKAAIEKSIEEARIGVQEGLKAYESLISNDEDRRLLDNNKRLFADYLQQLAPILDLTHQNRNDEALKAFNGLTAAAQALQKAFEDHMEYNKKLSTQATADSIAAMQSATWKAALISLVAIVVVGMLGVQIRSGLMARLNDANRMAAAIAGGDLSAGNTPASIGNDEAGQLVQALEKMRQDLARTVSAITNSSNSLSSSAAQLSTTAQQVSISTQSQSSSTSASAAAVEELTVSIDHVGANAEDASIRASDAGQLAIDSGRGVQTATQQINRVSTSIDETARQIHKLSEQVQQIGNITTVIRDVADQTNLLALNAAIEAARAGEQGRGFAVVADEVRKLAERTTLSVQEISTVITNIQDGVAVTVDSMQANCRLVADVVQSSEAASASMDGIREATEQVRDAITGISEAMREQRSASTELSRNVESIAQMSEENSAAVASVADTARSLVAVSDNLKSEVARFRL